MRVLPLPRAAARLRGRPEDFVVDEILGFRPSGSGAHALLRVRKRGRTTLDAVRWLAARYGVGRRDIGYCGLKDRDAVTSQWFSLPLDRAPDVPVEGDGFAVLEISRQERKLRRGVHRGNRFRIVARDFSGERGDVDERLERIAGHGFPNYFGEQRFGRDGGNLAAAWTWLVDDGRRPAAALAGILLSAVRAELFNRVLSTRLEAGTWDTPEPGDVAMLAGSRSLFRIGHVDPALVDRLGRGDIDLTGPLWGSDDDVTGADRLEWERALLGEDGRRLAAALEERAVRAGRRRLRARIRDLRRQWRPDGGLELEFELASGCYATALLRELIGPGNSVADDDRQPALPAGSGSA
jgi:tRNA pseudouridine13 synthase